MRYRRAFTVAAPLERVAHFHRLPSSFRALAPPGVPLKLEAVPELLVPGTEMTFRMWIGPVPVRWRATLGDLPGEGAAGFVDRQVEGPFRSWVHHHRFRALDDHHTEVEDTIEARLRAHPLWGPVGLALWMGLPLLFRWRALRTRRRLARDPTGSRHRGGEPGP